jgi:hypothetical protein
VPDVITPKTQLAEERLLEREHDRETIDCRGEPAGPARTPGPELWGDVVEDLGAGRMRRLGHPEVETGIVYQDYEVVAPALKIVAHGAQQPVVRSNFGKHLDDTEGGQSLHPVSERCPRLLHPGPPQRLDRGAGIPLPQRSDDSGGMEIA